MRPTAEVEGWLHYAEGCERVAAGRRHGGEALNRRGRRRVFRRAVKDLLRNILAAAPELDEVTAERIAGLLHDPERPVSARAVADYLGLRKTDWVYANAERLGWCRLGDSKRPRWRFYLSEVEKRLRDFDGPCAQTVQKTAEVQPRTPRRGERKDGYTRAGNALLDFDAA